MRHWILLLVVFSTLALSHTGWAEETAPPAIEPVTGEVELPDPFELLQAADRLFIDQKIGRVSAKIQVFRDPANLIPIKDLREDRVNAPGLIPLMGRYEYWSPNHFNFYLLGFLLASSETERGAAQGMTSPMLPLPGGIIASEFVQDRFRLRNSGIDAYQIGETTIDCYVVRMTPRDPDREFFKSLTYYISTDLPHVVRGVRANFSDGGGWTGTGWGNFYFLKDRKGHLLPFIGEGQINFQNPDRRVILKGRWRDFKFNDSAVVNPDAIIKDAPVAPLDRESAIGKF